jgi:hypothetical protein
MFGISRASVSRLRREMYNSTTKHEQSEDDNTNEYKVQLRSRAVSETSTLPKGVRRKKRKLSLDIPVASSPKKKGYSGRKGIEVTEQQQDNIR